jgi:transglutaminase-like putative cysteine protease
MNLHIPKKLRTTITLAALPDGVAGIKATLALMVDIARQSKTDFAVRNQALRLVQTLPQKDYLAEIQAIHLYVRDDVRYVKDIDGIETLATPAKTMLMMQGDCDDKALLAASLLLSLGHPVRFVAVGSSYNNFSHVLVETQMNVQGGKQIWIPVETTEPVALGWYPQGVPYRLVYNV